jgi:hypothetical protein
MGHSADSMSASVGRIVVKGTRTVFYSVLLTSPAGLSRGLD